MNKQVEDGLEAADTCRRLRDGQELYPSEVYMMSLADEVRRLRETEQKFAKMMVYVQQLEAQLADARLFASSCEDQSIKLQQLKTLPSNWRALASTVNDPSSPSIYVDCAEDLERVLNDE